MATNPNSTHESDIKLVTSYDPNEEGENKWTAWDDRPEDLIGTGPTEQKAIQDLFDQIYEEGH